MAIATLSFVINDTFMKLATDGLPPFEVLMLRGVAASLWCFPMVILMGLGPQLKLMFHPRIVVRNLGELGAVLFYVVALANLPIADTIALAQMTPLLVILGAAIIWREPVGALRWALIGLGFIGALMVAQPSVNGISVFSAMALMSAVMTSIRDMVSRTVPPQIPGMIVAASAIVIVFLGASVAHGISERFVVPEPRHILYLLGSGLFLIGGHFFIFTTYRVGPAALVAPFMYLFSFWAVISGIVVFWQFPNALALAGMLVVVGSGLAVARLHRPDKVAEVPIA
jgi:drug/metabolite transporter (DMT)-like permease